MVAKLLWRIGVAIAITFVLAAILVWALTPLPIGISIAIAAVGIMTGINIATIPDLPKGWFQQTIRTGGNNPKVNSRFGERIPEASTPAIDPTKLRADLDALRRRDGDTSGH